MVNLSEAQQVQMRKSGLTDADVAWAETAFQTAVARGNLDTANKVMHSEAFHHLVAARAAARAKSLSDAGTDFQRAITLMVADREMLVAQMALMGATITTLSKRVSAAEARLREGPFKYVGSYSPGVDYQHGQFVTYGGSIWFCNSAEPTRDKPGASEVWTLAVKRGKDGRDTA